MISKLLFIPRAAADIIKVLLHKNISFAERWNVAKALGKIKIASLSKKLNEPIVFHLGKWKINCLYNSHIGFLVKEIFVEEVYAIKNKAGVSKVLDMGSNIGLSIAYFKMRFPDVSIDAYEPDENSCSLLCNNIAQNKWENVKVNQTAVSNKNGFLFAELIDEKASVNSTFADLESSQNGKVVAKDISEILLQNFDIIKMDIEGGEWKVLKKIVEQQLIIKANNWFVEFHEIEKNKKQFEEIVNCFEQNGFTREERKEVVFFYKK